MFQYQNIWYFNYQIICLQLKTYSAYILMKFYYKDTYKNLLFGDNYILLKPHISVT